MESKSRWLGFNGSGGGCMRGSSLREARGAGRLERVDHVHVVRPRLCPVLPRVHGGIGADEVVLPVRRRTVPIVPFQRTLVIGALVAEGGAEGFGQGTVR